MEVNRAALVDQLHEEDQAYITEHWRSREHLVVTAYTRQYRNLGAASSQRGESFHQIVHQVMDGQETLEVAAKNLAARVERFHLELIEAEDRATFLSSVALDKEAFS